MRFSDAAFAPNGCPWFLEENDVVIFGVGESEGAVVRGRGLTKVNLEDS